MADTTFSLTSLALYLSDAPTVWVALIYKAGPHMLHYTISERPMLQHQGTAVKLGGGLQGTDSGKYRYFRFSIGKSI